MSRDDESAERRLVCVGAGVDGLTGVPEYVSSPVRLDRRDEDLETLAPHLDDIDCLLIGETEVDAATITGEIRELNADIPILVHSGQRDDGEISAALTAGADGVFDGCEETLQQQHLGRRIEREMQRYRTQQAMANGGRRGQVKDLEGESQQPQTRRVEAVVENLPVVLFSLDTDGTFTFSQGKGLEALGLESGGLVGANVFDVYDDNPDILEACRQALSGEAVQTTQEVDDLVFRTRYQPVKDADGTVDSVIGISLDVTAQKAYEAELERRKRQFEAVFNDPQLLVGLLDADGTVRRANETAMELVESERDEILGRRFPETEWWEHDAEMQAELAEWIARAADGEYVEFEATHLAPTGGEMIVSGALRPVTDDTGNVTSLVVSARDVTERKERKEQLEASNKRLEQFAYIASHDLQEPLRTVSNYTELIAEEYGDSLDDEADRLVDVVVTATQRMQSMINGLLDYSRVTTRGDDFEPVDTDAVVAAVVDDLGVVLDEHDETVTWESLPTVPGDRAQLRRLFQNLIKNALEHSEDDTADVVVRASDQGDRYRFEVEDSGPGIEERRQEKVFRMFKSSKQYQTSTQAKGIGLAVCDSIVTRHRGTIWVESEPGDGATFVFTIAKADEDPR